MTIERGLKRIHVVLSVLLTVGALITTLHIRPPEATTDQVLGVAAAMAGAWVGLLWTTHYVVRWCIQGFTGPAGLSTKLQKTGKTGG